MVSKEYKDWKYVFSQHLVVSLTFYLRCCPLPSFSSLSSSSSSSSSLPYPSQGIGERQAAKSSGKSSGNSAATDSSESGYYTMFFYVVGYCLRGLKESIESELLSMKRISNKKLLHDVEVNCLNMSSLNLCVTVHVRY